MNTIEVPRYAKIIDYRTMTPTKKLGAANGNKLYQNEWMKEEVNEFYEAVYLNDTNEIIDEAIGLIRTAHQFHDSKRVMKKWYAVSCDVLKVLYNKRVFLRGFRKWHKKKLKKGQAKGVKPSHLSDFAGLSF